MSVEWWLTVAVVTAGGYLCGAIPFGLLVGRCKGVDIRTQGSRNIGATNAGRVLGRPYGILVFLLDGLKGFVPVFIAGRLIQDSGTTSFWCPLAWVVVAVACVLGHMFPVYLGFKGGKGVATSLGVGLAIYPYYTVVGVACFVAWAILVGMTRYVSLASVVAAGLFPVLFAVLSWHQAAVWGGLGRLWPLHAFSIVIAMLVVYRHRANLHRLAEGVEPRIGGPRPAGK